jgi:hypothetical protein
MKRLPRDASSYLPWAVTSFCDDKMVAEAKDFFGERMKKVEGGTHQLDLALEEMHLCAAQRAPEAASAARFFARKP